MPASVIGAVKVGLNKQPKPAWNSYVLLVGSGFAAGQAVRIERSPFRWEGAVTVTDGTFAIVRVNRVLHAIEKDAVIPLVLPVGPETCSVTIDAGAPTDVVIDLYDA